MPGLNRLKLMLCKKDNLEGHSKEIMQMTNANNANILFSYRYILWVFAAYRENMINSKATIVYNKKILKPASHFMVKKISCKTETIITACNCLASTSCWTAGCQKHHRSNMTKVILAGTQNSEQTLSDV